MYERNWEELKKLGIGVSINGIMIVTYQQPKSGDEMILYAPEGKAFSYVYFSDPFIGSVEWKYNDDKSQAFATVHDLADIEIGSLDALIVTSSIAPNRAYSLTTKQFAEFNKESKNKRYQGNESLDYSAMIINAVVLPFKLDDSEYLGESNVWIFDMEMGATGDLLKNDIINISFDPIKIEKPADSRGFENVEIKMHLPFIPSFNIESGNVFGHLINIKYIFNSYDGIVQVLLSNENDVVFHDESYVVAEQMPMPNYGGNAVSPTMLKGDFIKRGYDSGIYEPTIEIIRKSLVNVIDDLRANVLDSGVLDGVKGLVTVEEMELNVDATGRELQLIDDFLKRGVFIK